jgi:hypothetical protein
MFLQAVGVMFDMVERRNYNGRILDGWDTAQICLNGHTVNTMFVNEPDHNSAFCKGCGAKTITACPTCSAPIRGHYHIEMTPGRPPLGGPSAFCHGCGKSYPWTSARIAAAKSMVDEVEGLDDAERILLKASIDDIAAETRFQRTRASG